MQITIEQSIDLMAETLLQQLQTHVDNNNIDYSDAIYDEWITPDSNDPQDLSLIHISEPTRPY